MSKRDVAAVLATVMVPSSLHAGVVGSISGSCSVDSVSVPIDAALLVPEVTVFECLEFGVPFTGGLASVELQTAGTDCEDLGGTIEIVAVSTWDEVAEWGITEIARLSPPFPITPCPPVVIQNYGTHTGNQSAYSFSIGSLFSNGPVIKKVLAAEMTWDDTVEILSEVDTTIALPLHVSGSILAAESFGTSATRGYAELSMSGTVGGVAFDESIEVESVTVIPEQDSIDVSRLIEVPVSAGSNLVVVSVCARAMVESTAQGAGLIAGAATAGVSYSDSLTIGRFVAADGGRLPDGLLIRSAATDLVYEDTTKSAPGADLDGDGFVGFQDLLTLLSRWGPCEDPGACPTDFDGDGDTGFLDLIVLLSQWS